ncbi:MAG: hypothetical protein JWO58_3125 [Chitinophagaceae bacterium]|nr:hypothetical protein [Chitinophagaceae bacterium]
MKHFLFCLLFSLICFSGTVEAYTTAGPMPCITINGKNSTPGASAGALPYAYKCINQTVRLAVRNCGSGPVTVDPSQFDYSWVNTSTGTFTYTSPTVDTNEEGVWVVTISYTDPVYGTVYTANDTLNLINYAPVTPVLAINSGNAVLAHCSYESITFTATVGSQYLANSYKWYINSTGTTDTTVSVAGTGSSLTTVIPTVKYVTVMASDINGCRVLDNIYAPLQSSPAPPDLGPDKQKCPGTNLTLSTTYNASYTYYWNGSSTGQTGANANTYVASTPAKYWVAVSGGALSPCRIADTVYVSDYTPPLADIGADTSICYHATGPMHVNVQGAGPMTYSWTPISYFGTGSTTIANPTIDFSSSGLGTFLISVLVTDGNGCSITKSKNVTHLGQGSNPYLFVTANPIDICQGTTKIFNTTDYATYPTSLSYQWTPSTYLNDATAEKPTVDLTGAALNTPISYSLKVSDTKGCYLTITTSATLVPAVVANVGFTDTSICRGNSVTLQSSGSGGTGAFTYAWSPATDLDNAALQNPVSTPTSNRTYGVTVTDAVGCSDSKTVNVNSIDVQAMLIPTDTFGYNTEPMVLNPVANSNAYKYLWSNITTNTTLDTNKAQTVTETGTYKFIATEPASGCHVSDSINVTIQVGNPRLIYIPNVVNPASANPENKTVKVYGTAVQENDFAFRIYNKWGELIYETNSFADANTKGWNGVYKTSNGTEQTLSVYTYSVHGKYFDGQEFNKTGSITLLR